jgi:DDE family transposase
MFNSKPNKLTPEERAFLIPKNPLHRQYEALRAFFVDKIPSDTAAERFGYSPGSFRVLCCEFRKNLDRPFFSKSKKGPHASPKKDHVRKLVIDMRKQNYSVYDIHRELISLDKPLSIPSIAAILKEEGFARLPRRSDEEIPAHLKPEPAPVADVRQFQLTERQFRTKFGGLFLFLPLLAQIPLEHMIAHAEFPGTDMIPAACAVRSLLALKLFGNARHSHVMSYVFDEGLALFTGLNAIPKRSFLTEYSCRVDPKSHSEFMNEWFDAVSMIGLERGVSFDLDFHTIPFHGEDALIQKHYVSKRSRKQKGVLSFLAWDGENQHFCYANASLRKEEQNDEILRFVEFWKKRTNQLPKELVFDSRLTTYNNLCKLNKMGIQFITLKRRSKKMLQEVHSKPLSAWRTIELGNISRKYRTPRIIDEIISIPGYDGPIRQIAIIDLGHEEPTFLLTNQLKKSAKVLVDRYARRMIIENAIADGIDFFHMDALSSSVAMKVDFDLQLTLMASSLYRLLGCQLGNGYESAKSRHIFRDFIDSTATVSISKQKVVVKFQKKAHNPFLIKAGLDKIECKIPWWGERRLCLQFG